MKTYKSLNRKQSDDVMQLVELLDTYLNLWGYSPTTQQLNHLKEMISIVIKTNSK